MKRTEPGLRGRFLLATWLLSAALIGGFVLAIAQFLEVIEDEFIGSQFALEFERYEAAYEHGRLDDMVLPRGFHGVVVGPGNKAEVPADVASLAPGVYTEITVDGSDFSVGKRTYGDTTLYLFEDLDIEPIELLERHLLDIALRAGVTAVLVGFALSLWLSNLVTAPVNALARTVSAIEPGRERGTLDTRTVARELRGIAQAFDRVLTRFDEYGERERAFTRDASHELRTPLAVIRSSLQLLEQDARDARGAARVARLRAAAEQMQALLEALLFLARGDGDGHGEPVAVAAQIEAAVALLGAVSGPQAPAVQVHVQSDFSVTAPRGLLLCVLNNLLRNALEHADGDKLDITLDGPTLVIEDNGRGIPAELLPRVFEQDVRGVDSSGQGHGLSLVQRVCTRLGWHLELASESGRGTRWALTLARPGDGQQRST